MWPRCKPWEKVGERSLSHGHGDRPPSSSVAGLSPPAGALGSRAPLCPRFSPWATLCRPRQRARVIPAMLRLALRGRWPGLCSCAPLGLKKATPVSSRRCGYRSAPAEREKDILSAHVRVRNVFSFSPRAKAAIRFVRPRPHPSGASTRAQKIPSPRGEGGSPPALLPAAARRVRGLLQGCSPQPRAAY